MKRSFKITLFLILSIFLISNLSGCLGCIDLSAPTVLITSPADASGVSGIVNIIAEANDDTGIAKVEFYIDGSKIGESTNRPYTYAWDTNNEQYGTSHTIQAKAYDINGKIGESPIIRVTVIDNLAPTVNILTPRDGETVSGIVNIQVEATDRSRNTKAPSGIQKVEFYVNGSKIGEDNTSPYSWSWNTNNLTYGSTHTIQAKAYDNAGRVGESQIVRVTIGNTLPPIVTITSPQDGEIVPVSKIITVKVEVQERGKEKLKATNISKVEFYLDGNLKGTDTSSPYEYNLDTSGLKHNTIHTIKVKAYDTAGNIGEASVNITINAEWTIMMYLDGHNNLYQAITNELNLLNNVTSTAGINVLILAGLSQTSPTATLYYFHNGEMQILSNYNCNFGNPDYLKGFLSYGVQNYPAKKYMVIIKDHGSGWRKKTVRDLSRDICFDEIYNDSLTIPELRSALNYIKVLLGRKIDLLFLDAYLMGTIEVDYDLKDLANYLVSSEATRWSGNTRWDVLFNQLVSVPTISANALGILTAQTYFDSYIEPRTIAVKDLSKIDDIAKDIYDFAYYLRNYVNTHKTTIMSLRNQTQSFAPYQGGPNEYIDLYQFSELIRTESGIGNINLLNSILNLQQSINSSLVYRNDSGYPSGAINGYSIWFPATYSDYLAGKSKYESLLFTNIQLGKEWQLFLEGILSP